METRKLVTDTFERRWNHIHSMTRAFAECVPDACWTSRPLDGFAPFAKQLRHVVCVRGVYNAGLRTRRIDFGTKHSHYHGGLGRSELVAALDATHRELLALLESLSVGSQPADFADPCIDFFGRKISYSDYLWCYVQHESIHHGQWSLYAAAGGYEPPDVWRTEWGLAADRV